MAEHNELGKIGEAIAKTFLMKQGFTVIGQNYRTKYGELDIIARKDSVLRFVEVKSVKVRGCANLENLKVRPEDNLTFSKWLKLKTTIAIYLQNYKTPHEPRYQIDLACVYLDTEKREGGVKLLENIHL
jgi:putative endonuclease